MADQNFRVKKGLEVGIGGSIITTNNIGNVGIGTTNPSSKLYVVGDAYYTGVVTATTFNGALTGTATTATKLQNSRTFEITGDVVASAVSFDGTGNVSLAATIQPNSVALGTDTTGDYVQSISGTSNQITVTSGSGEGSTPVIAITTNPTLPGNVTVQNDLIVDTSTLVVNSATDRVGIGTTNPLQRFQIGTANTLGINTNATVFVVTSNADVGIGTTNPTSKLYVVGDGYYTGVVTATTFNGGLNKDVIAGNGLTGGGTLSSNVTLNVGAGSGIAVNADDIQLKNAGSLTNNYVLKWDGSNTQLTSSNIIDTGTNIGIGTTNPSARLSIGSGSFTDANVPVQISTQSASGIAYYGANNNGSYGALFGYDRNAYSGGVVRVVGATDTIDFVVNNNTLAARFDSSGNLGLGASTSSGTTYGLYLKNNANVSFAGAISYYDSNSAYSSGADRYIVNAAATRYQHINGAHIWYNAPVGIAGSSIGFSQAMTLNSGGNLLLGTVTDGPFGRNLILNGTNSSGILFRVGDVTKGFVYADSTDTYIGANTGAVAFKPADTERMRLDANGNLGINTTTINTKLNVVGIQTTDVNSSTVGPTLISNSTNNVDTTTLQTVLSLQRFGKTGTSYNSQVNFNVGRYNQTGTGGNTQLTLRLTNGTTNDPDTDVMSLWANGNVGIGTINPGGNRLRVNKDLGTNDYISVAQHNSQFQIGRVSDNKSLEFAVLDNGTSVIQSKEVSVGYNNLAIQPNANVLINSLTATGTATQALQVNSGAYFNGNVGIGITNPNTKLHIASGNIQMDWGAYRIISNYDNSYRQGLSYDATNRQLRIFSTTNDTGGTIGFYTRNGAGASDTDYGSERVRIDNLGNLGINTTSPLQKLHTLGNFLLAADGTTANHITQKPYTINNGTLSWEGSAGQLFSITNNLTSGSIFSVNDVSGIPSIDVNADGTVLIAPYTGNVGVGTLTPTAKLDVNGDAKINELTIGKGKGNIFVNVAFGYKTLFSNTTGYSNVAIGYSALYSNTTGQRNVSTGTLALLSNTTGSYNTAIGHITLTNNTTGQENTAIGNQALYSNTTSNGNTAVGKESLTYNTTGYQNTAVGGNALLTNDNGYQNTAVGFEALTSNGVNANTAVGYRALYSNTIGYYNTALGYSALYSNTTANNNIAIGYQTLSTTNTGGSNTAIGHQALYANTTGYNNTAIGYGSGNSCITGTNNTFLGSSAVDTAGGNAASNTIVLGNSSVTTLRCNTSTISALSDVRDKKDIMDIPLGLSFLNELRPVKFTWNQRDGGRVDLPDSGFIAQEALEVVNKYDAEWFGLVDHQNPEHFELSPGKLIPVLVKAVQELSQQNQELKELIDTITQKN